MSLQGRGMTFVSLDIFDFLRILLFLHSLIVVIYHNVFGFDITMKNAVSGDDGAAYSIVQQGLLRRGKKAIFKNASLLLDSKRIFLDLIFTFYFRSPDIRGGSKSE